MKTANLLRGNDNNYSLSESAELPAEYGATSEEAIAAIAEAQGAEVEIVTEEFAGRIHSVPQGCTVCKISQAYGDELFVIW